MVWPMTTYLHTLALPACDPLKQAVESAHGCKANFAQSVPVRQSFDGRPDWEGVVHIFNVIGNPQTTRAYAWSAPAADGADGRIIAMLHVPPVDCPIAAVREAVAQEFRDRATNED